MPEEEPGGDFDEDLELPESSLGSSENSSSSAGRGTNALKLEEGE